MDISSAGSLEGTGNGRSLGSSHAIGSSRSLANSRSLGSSHGIASSRSLGSSHGIASSRRASIGGTAGLRVGRGLGARGPATAAARCPARAGAVPGGGCVTSGRAAGHVTTGHVGVRGSAVPRGPLRRLAVGRPRRLRGRAGLGHAAGLRRGRATATAPGGTAPGGTALGAAAPAAVPRRAVAGRRVVDRVQ